MASCIISSKSSHNLMLKPDSLLWVRTDIPHNSTVLNCQCRSLLLLFDLAKAIFVIDLLALGFLAIVLGAGCCSGTPNHSHKQPL